MTSCVCPRSDRADSHGNDHACDHGGELGDDHEGDHVGDHDGDHGVDHADDHGGDNGGDHNGDHGSDQDRRTSWSPLVIIFSGLATSLPSKPGWIGIIWEHIVTLFYLDIICISPWSLRWYPLLV